MRLIDDQNNQLGVLSADAAQRIAGEKVKVTIMFRGREMVHQEIGRRLLDRVADAAKEIAVVERQPLLEGRNLFMILAPSHKQAPKEAAPTSA